MGYSLGFVFLAILNFASHSWAASPYQDKLLEELLLAEPGTVIEIPEGRYEIDVQLSLTVDNVTIRGQGAGKSVLNFKGQKEGGEGLLVTSSFVTLENFSIEDTPADAIKVSYAEGITLRGLEVKWTRGPHTNNGAYGIYPVRTKDVLVEGCYVSGASDAGIYVGQSSNVIIRRNVAENNVAGIEVENSSNVDVYHNYATNNTGGLLVFDLPDLKTYIKDVRVFGNTIVDNNTTNFAAPSNSVADVPRGTGLMIMSSSGVEVFDNLIRDHGTANILLTSYVITERPINDPNFDPYVERIYIHHNTIANGGFAPEGGSSEGTKQTVAALKELLGTPLPDIIWPGFRNPAHIDASGKLKDDFKICIQHNNTANFVDLDLENNLEKMSFDLSAHDCKHAPIPEASLP